MEAIVTCKQSAINGMDYFLRNFSHVPDDKLTYTPTPTAKSPLRIAAHTALYAGRFAAMIRNRQVPQPDNLAEWLAQRDAEEIAITTREEVEIAFRKGTQEVIEALDTLSEEDIALVLDSGQGWSLPMTQVMRFAGWHATLHAGQIDFLQTCWGDQEIYI